jgi:hypothetical protein
VAAGTTCRAAAGACDVAESCTGAGALCPADTKVAAGTECRASAGICDVAESCDGAGNDCPANGFVVAGTECRAAVAGGCDVAESCTGAAAACPADVVAVAGTVCRASAGVCDAAETCSGASNSCPADAKVANGTTCRASAGVCDVAETCNGAANDCPADGFVAAGHGVSRVRRCVRCGGELQRAPARPVLRIHEGARRARICRASAGVCDVAESCDGAGNDCPAGLASWPASTECRAAVAGGCDVAESCTGASAACPADVVVARRDGVSRVGGRVRRGRDLHRRQQRVSSRCEGGGRDDMSRLRRALRRSRDVHRRSGRVSRRCVRAGEHGVPRFRRRLRRGGDAARARRQRVLSDTKVAAGAVCRASAGACDPAEACDGRCECVPCRCEVRERARCVARRRACAMWPRRATAPANVCPGDGFVAAGTDVSRGGRWRCDVAETLHGSRSGLPR